MRTWTLIAAAVILIIPAAALVWDSRGSVAASHRSPPVVEPTAKAPAWQAPLRDARQDAEPHVRTWAKARALELAVQEAMAGFSGRYSVAVHDLATGRQWTRNARDRYHPASTVKMPVTLYTLEQYRAGKLGWQDYIVYTPADFESPGGGAFETSPFGGWYPVENLVGRAIRYSNNVAVNMLGRHLGWENIEAWSRTIGGDLYRSEAGSLQVTALSELGWWRHLERLSREDPENAALLLVPLREVAYDGRIGAGLPEGVPYLHKFGSLHPDFHDGGWIMGDRPFLLVIMTGDTNETEADQYIPRVAAAVYEVMVQE
ncbi:MAG TPA: serine hydrolase [Symbiobacteriaceae bacterium]|nr:serine hydrolase [Symbiobacteriaceae bacterium]